MFKRFFVGVLQFEELSAQRPGIFLRALQLCLRLLVLLFPLCQDLQESFHFRQKIDLPLQWNSKCRMKTLSKFLCFLSRAAAAALDLSTSTMRSSISFCSLCLVFSREEHLAFTASTASSASCRRWASFFLGYENIYLWLNALYLCWVSGLSVFNLLGLF